MSKPEPLPVVSTTTPRITGIQMWLKSYIKYIINMCTLEYML